MAPGLSLDATIRRVQESWEATRASEMKSSPGNGASRDPQAEIQRMKGLNRTSAASSHLGKRSSSGAYEEVLERKRRTVEHGRNASGRQGLSNPISNGSSEEASRRRSAPTTGTVNMTSADKPQDGPQVLRAVRSATNKPLSPALRGAEAKTARLQVLEKTASGRPYKVFEDHEGKMISTAGALIPDGYEQHDDDALPFICPVRSCRKLYRNMTALGAHFGAGHRLVNLNDNGDGTLSIVGQFKTVSGPITARVVSRMRLDPSEPPMPIPKPPGYVRPITTTRDDSPPPATEKTATAASRRSLRAPPPAVDSSESSSPPSWSPSPVSSLPAPTPDLGTKVMPYLRAVFPPNFDFGLFTVCKEGPLLLQLPVKRHATSNWIGRITSLKTRSQRCPIALLLFLTGTPAANPCPSCVTSESGDECIIPSASFPSFVIERFEGSCAACFYRCNRWHQKNQCLLRKARETTDVDRKAAFEFLLAGLGKDDMPPEIDDEAVESDVLPDERSELAKEAVENEGLAFAELQNRASKDGTLPVKRPGPANGTSKGHTQLKPSSPRPPTPEPYITSPTRESQGAPTNGALLNQGNLMPADALEMEHWEIAPGTIRNTSDEPDNVAFSNAYLFSNMAIPVAPGIAFNVITLKPGGGHKFPAQQSLRLCSLATGKLSVKMEQESGDVGFQIGPNGMFKVYPGTVASVRNRLYVDAVLHVSTMESSDA